MVGRLSRGLLILAAFILSTSTVAIDATIQAPNFPREDIDVSRHPWSAIGKLYNGTGSACSAVAISSDKILTAAHCLFNHRTRRFIPAAALHVLLGYRAGRYTAHVRIAQYEIGSGFDPQRYPKTIEADFAVLTVRERLPARIEPLRLSQAVLPRGTKAMIAGYPQDRAHALTADRDCELRDKIDDGRLFMHSCRGARGYSGAPILVAGSGHELRVAGIQIASLRSDGTEKMVAVSAQAIRQRGLRAANGLAPGSRPADRRMNAPQDVADGLGRNMTAQWQRPGSAESFDAAVAAWQARLPAIEIAASHGNPAAVVAP